MQASLKRKPWVGSRKFNAYDDVKTPKEKLIEALRDSCQDYLDGKTNDTEKIRLESLIFSVHEASDGDIDKAMKLLHCNDEEMPEPGNQSDQEQG